MRRLTDRLAKELGIDTRVAEEDRLETAIAIVGMAGHFPGARDLDEFWECLAEGRECLTEFSSEELAAAGVPDSLVADPAYVPSAPILDEMEWFDAGFFGLSPRDAAIMDPQHRHFLECCWEALEDAGHVPSRFDGSIGVFAGSGTNSYFWRNVMTNPELVHDVGFFLLRHTGNDKDFLSTRVSYAFDLKGPSVNVQTACSTSLVAVHYAAQSLLSGECDMALAGGSTVEQPHRVGYLYQEGEILSPDGHCRPFDADSAGTLFGSGAGAVLLKRYHDAVADGDHIYALIVGSAINNDGAGKVGYLAPSVEGQVRAIQEALSIADVSPETVSYIETHGTGTRMGDPIEVAALTQAFRGSTDRAGFCGLGSIKSNIGHLDTAAGIAGVIKVALSMEHELLPATLNFSAPNPNVDWSGSPFYVVSESRAWPHDGSGPRRAGVSSLGVGGTNAHLVLEEPPASRRRPPSDESWRVIPLSARSKPALERAGARLAECLEGAPGLAIGDVAHTLSVGRQGFAHRRAVVARSAEDIVNALGTRKSDYAVDGEAAGEDLSTVFMFAGGGAQYPGMARDLFESEPTFRAALDRCLLIGREQTGRDLVSLLYPSAADHAAAALELKRPSVALPILFSVQYAMAQLLESWGVRPTALIGHSMGEYTAACISGVLSVDGALEIVSLRGRLFEELGPGGMVSVSASEEVIRSLLPPELSIAAVNAPEMCVVAGPVDPLAQFEDRLASDGFDTRRVHIDVAAHSKMLDPILEPFAAGLEHIQFGKASIPFVSNLSGEWIEDEAADPEYWVRHLRECVRFSDGLARIAQDSGAALVEVGPGRTLATLAKANPHVAGDRPIVTTVRHPDDEMGDVPFALKALATLWASGGTVDLGNLSDENAGRVSLPTYPFEKARHWIEPGQTAVLHPAPPEEAEEPGVRHLDEWFSMPTWNPEPLPSPVAPIGESAVVFGGGLLAKRIHEELKADGVVSRWVRDEGEDEIGAPAVDVTSDQAWADLFGTALADAKTGLLVFYLPQRMPPGGSIDATERANFYGLVHLLRGLEGAGPDVPVRLIVGAFGLSDVGDRTVEPGAHLLLGPARVGPREFPGLLCRVVDVDGDEVQHARHVLAEAGSLDSGTAPGSEPDRETQCVSYVDGRRHVRGFAPVRLEAAPDWSLSPQKTYLITGGLGGLGMTLAEDLAKTLPGICLVLVGRTRLPDRWQWSDLIESGDKRLAEHASAIERLEASGATVHLAAADLTDEDAVRQVMNAVGPVHGVFHAAGSLDDAPILAKTDEEWAAVLGPKVRGTDVLWRALDGHPVDFMVCFSSRSAVTGLAGQVDYAAANAFLDGFATRWDRPDRRIIAVGWDAWGDVGMAYRFFGGGEPGDAGGDPQWTPIDDAIFDRTATTGRGMMLSVILGQDDRHWMLEDHRLKSGPRLIPGSGYVEIVRAAAAIYLGTPVVELSELMFLEPFVVRDGQRRELIVELVASENGGVRVEIRGRDPSGGTETTHVRGAVSSADLGEWKAVKPRALRKRCKRGKRHVGGSSAHPHLDFGPRWANLVDVSTGANEALATLALASDLHRDLRSFPLHPGLLDMATAAGLDALPGFDAARDFYVPTSYGSVRVGEGFRSDSLSHVQVREGSGDGVAVFDVRIYGEDGTPLIEIDEFVMMRIESFNLPDPSTEDSPVEDDQLDWRRFAIPSAQGLDALRRIMAQAPSSRILVTPRPLEQLLEEAAEMSRAAVSHRKRPPPQLDFEAVEAGLESHQAVAEAAVTASWVGPDEYRVVAFLAFAPAQHATVSELRRHLKASLPPDLVPNSYIETTELPRLADGRVDRKSLPNPFDDAGEHVPPRTETEIAIARIWEDLLGVERVSLHDNFLDVGGHSLIGIRTLLRIEKETGYRLHPNALTLQTLEQIAAECDRGNELDEGSAPEPESLAGRLIGAVRHSVGGGN